QAVGFEPEVPDHRGPEPFHGVQDGGRPVPGGDLHRLPGSTELRPALEHQHATPAPGQVGRADQAVVSRSDHDGVVAAGRGAHRRAVLRTSPAASRPGAPMIPPPGCAEDPHSHRFRTGARNRPTPAAGRLQNSCSRVSSPWKMLPSVSPSTSSRSRGESTCRCRMRSLMLGANRAMASTTASPKASRSRSSHSLPSARWYGAYCTKQLTTCFPGGASEESTVVRISMSMKGSRENRPYLASSYARSR